MKEDWTAWKFHWTRMKNLQGPCLKVLQVIQGYPRLMFTKASHLACAISISVVPLGARWLCSLGSQGKTGARSSESSLPLSTCALSMFMRFSRSMVYVEWLRCWWWHVVHQLVTFHFKFLTFLAARWFDHGLSAYATLPGSCWRERRRRTDDPRSFLGRTTQPRSFGTCEGLLQKSVTVLCFYIWLVYLISRKNEFRCCSCTLHILLGSGARSSRNLIVNKLRIGA